MQVLLKVRWSLAYRAALASHRWADEFVVHHALSNDTHRLSELAGCILQVLGTTGALDAEELARKVGRDTEEVDAALAALEALDLIARC